MGLALAAISIVALSFGRVAVAELFGGLALLVLASRTGADLARRLDHEEAPRAVLVLMLGLVLVVTLVLVAVGVMWAAVPDSMLIPRSPVSPP